MEKPYPQQLGYPQPGYPQQQQPQQPGYPQPGYPQQQHQQQQQPQAQPPMMTSGGGNRNVKNLPMGPEGREWNNGLCDCCNEPGTCVAAWCCPCMVYASNKKRLEHLERNGTPDPERGGGNCSGSCCLHASILMFLGAGFILQCLQRGDTRKRYNISGGTCGDCCSSLFCSPCQLTQERQEIELEEKYFGGYSH